MNYSNISVEKNKAIKEADLGIRSLVDIINELDSKLSEWKCVADEFGCDSPDELAEKVRALLLDLN